MMNTFSNTIKTIFGLAHSDSKAFTKTLTKKVKNQKQKLTQRLLLLLTGFLVSQFFLLNILHSQHPLGGWVTPFGSISTQSLLSIVLLTIFVCLISLWHSTSNTAAKRVKINNYSKPATFMSVSPE